MRSLHKWDGINGIAGWKGLRQETQILLVHWASTGFEAEQGTFDMARLDCALILR